MCKFQDPSTLVHISTATWYQFFTKMGLILKRVNFGLKHMIWHFSISKSQYFPHSSAPYGPICLTKVGISIVRIFESQNKGQNAKKCEKIWAESQEAHQNQTRISYDCNYCGKTASNSSQMHTFRSYNQQRR